MYGHIYHSIKRPGADLLMAFGEIPTATLSDAMGRHGAMSGAIRPLFEGAHVAGAALTVLCFPGDNLMVHKALQMIEPGDVLVVDVGGHDTACFGHKSAQQVKARGGAGTVVGGSVRDVAMLRRDRLPVFARSISPRAPQKNTAGSINVPVETGGLVVFPGDIVVGDDDGVVVIPLDDAERVLEAARARDRHEQKTSERFDELPLDPTGARLDLDELLKGKVIEHHEPADWRGHRGT